MSDARDLAALRRTITFAESRMETQRGRIARWPSESAQARYASTVLHVLERSLKGMYRQRVELECELRRRRRAQEGEALRKMRPFGFAAEGERGEQR